MKKEEHSQKVQQIMEQKPAFIIRFGNLIILVLMIIGGVIFYLSHS